MSTRSIIAKQLPSGGYKAIYCHWDGYPQKPGVGWCLKKDYNDSKKVDELISLGDISSLKSEVGQKHNFDEGHLVWTTAYYRDRGEETWDDVKPKTLKDLQSLERYANDANAEWLYIYRQKKPKKDTANLKWSDNYWVKDSEDKGNWKTIKI